MNYNVGIQCDASPSFNISLNVQWSLLNVYQKPLKKARSHTPILAHTSFMCAICTSDIGAVTLRSGYLAICTHICPGICVKKRTLYLSPGIPCYQRNAVHLDLVHYTHTHSHTHTWTHTIYSRIFWRLSSPAFNYLSLSCHIFFMANT